jgi:hypothetical protein
MMATPPINNNHLNFGNPSERFKLKLYKNNIIYVKTDLGKFHPHCPLRK